MNYSRLSRLFFFNSASALILTSAAGGCAATSGEGIETDETPGEVREAAARAPVRCRLGLVALEERLAQELDTVAASATTPNLTLLLQTEDGRRFTHSHGNSTATTPYASASTSKLVASIVILDLVEQGLLSLDSKPHDMLAFWTGESSVTLRHLLSFTSGFAQEPSCVDNPRASFEACVEKIYNQNLALPPPQQGQSSTIRAHTCRSRA